MPLRRASRDDLHLLHVIRDAAQSELTGKGSLQVLSDIDENAISEYWLFSPVISANEFEILQSHGSSFFASNLPFANVAERSSSTLGPLSDLSYVGSLRVSAHVPTHIEPHLTEAVAVDGTIDTPREHWYLSSVVLHPRFQLLGLGRQMLMELQQLVINEPDLLAHSNIASATSPRSLGLDVWAGNDRLQRWYGVMGWRYVATVEESDESSCRT